MKVAEPGNPAWRGWFDRQGLKLVARPYLSESFAMQRMLERLPVESTVLRELTVEDGGIFSGPLFSRVYVTTPEHSVPFVGSRDMLVADFSALPRLRKSDAELPGMRRLKLQAGSTLISRSGFNAGRRAYVRPDMAGFWSSEDVIKVVPDQDKIQPGYLYAFLSSRFGEVLVRSGVYGSAVKHIAPDHVGGIRVPRFGDAVENEIHELIQGAADLRAEFQAGLEGATRDLFRTAGIEELLDLRWHEQGRDLGFFSSHVSALSLRASNYGGRARELREALESVPYRTLGDICRAGELRRGSRFSRVEVDPGKGIPFVGQLQAFWLRPEKRWIVEPEKGDLHVADETIMVASRGLPSENGLFGRAILVTGEAWTEMGYTEDFLRVRSGDPDVPGAYLFALLRSEASCRIFRSMMAGTGPQAISPVLRDNFPVPVLTQPDRDRIAATVRAAYKKRDEADRKEGLGLAKLEEAVTG
ncbi:methylation-associated defense system restriction endonuclease subunit S MAD5 [Streptomyces tendae]|uniref:methylation-associated defense system restriction endonuclease subunit S MAD5 n=1 Tax=Streptomyces tendae TaxID=1932 RepID=UPI003711E695